MAEGSNALLARTWFRNVWLPGGESTVHELMHPEAVGHLEGADVHGPAEFLPARAALLDAFPDISVRVDDLIEQGDQVAVRWSVTATHGGDGLGIPASQQKVSFRGITWMRFAHGRVVEGWDAWNQGQLLTSLASAQIVAKTAADVA